MSDRWDDRDLRELFQLMRDDDAAATPPFQRFLHVSRHPRPTRWAPAAGLAAAAMIAAIVFVATRRDGTISSDEAIAQAKSLSSWTAPTDAWLKLPGLEIPSSVPSLSLSSVPLPESSADETVSGGTR